LFFSPFESSRNNKAIITFQSENYYNNQMLRNIIRNILKEETYHRSIAADVIAFVEKKYNLTEDDILEKGGYGIAYNYGNGAILKLTGDYQEAKLF
jgi:hypothetical protein